MEEIKENDSVQVMLAEYCEAGKICRWYEHLTRTSLSVYLPFALVLVGFIEEANFGETSKVLLCVGGFIISILLINMVLRQQVYYRVYIERAKGIENKLGMLLYTEGENAEMPTLSLTNKNAIIIAIAVFAVYFLARGIHLFKTAV